MHKNSKFQKVENGYKIDINHLRGLKNLRKTIFNDSRTNFAQNRILKKKVAKFAQKYWKSQIFWISNGHKLAGIGPNRPNWSSKISASSILLPKIFFCSKTKNWRRYQKNLAPPPQKGPWGGGVKLLNVVWSDFH